MDVFRSKYGGLNYIFRANAAVPRTLVLLHGLGSSQAQFENLVQSVKSVASVLVIDLPGHGENMTAEHDEISFEVFSTLILELCDELDLKSAVFAGISMGSALALACAARRPDLARQLVVIRPSWLAKECPAHLSIIDRCGQWLSKHSAAAALKQLEADATYIDIHDDVPLAAASVRGLFDRAHANAHAHVLTKMYHSAPVRSLNGLRSIKTPAIVVGTHADSLHPLAIAKATANALPNAELTILPPRYLQPEKHQTALNELILNIFGEAA